MWVVLNEGGGAISGLLLEDHGRWCEIIFNRPDKKNAIDTETWNQIADTAKEINRSNSKKVIVLSGVGGDFSTGADLMDPKALELDSVHRMRLINEAIESVANISAPTVSFVDGYAVGAGMALALICDLTIATSRSKFCQIFAKRGLSVDGGSSYILPRLVGLKKAKELAFLSEMIDGAKAQELGLINYCGSPEDARNKLYEWVDILVKAPYNAITMTKSLLNQSNSHTLREALESEANVQCLNFSSEDFSEAIEAFAQKREPNFK